ncbi:hypothetical protein CR513_36727, partial [Mucuna pruriens]
MFQDLRFKSRGSVTFGGNKKGKIVGINKISKHIFPFIDNVLFVEGLKHNLLSISHFLCDHGYDVSFNKGECIVKNPNGSQIFSAKRQNNLYKINLINLRNQSVTCLKLEHASLRLILKLKLVRGLLCLVYKIDFLYDAC